MNPSSPALSSHRLFPTASRLSPFPADRQSAPSKASLDHQKLRPFLLTSKVTSMSVGGGESSITNENFSQSCIYGHLDSSNAAKKSRFMRWLKKILKGLGYSTSNDRLPRVRKEDNVRRRGPTRSSNERSRREDEDLDRAIALSLGEKDAGFKGRHDHDSDDDVLSRAIRESLNLPQYSPAPPRQILPNRYKICGGCHREIGHGQYLSGLGTLWHPECFRCHACGLPIREKEFSLSGTSQYHRICYRELYHPRCDVCLRFIPTNLDGLVEYRAHPFWHQKYCPSHEHDGTPRCCSCERLESRKVRYIALGDGRSLCLECLDSSIMDTGDCQPLYHGIRDYYEGMNMKIDQQIPMLLVEREALNEALEGEKGGFRHMPETRGLCLSEEQTISSIFRKPRIGSNRAMDMKTHPQKLVRRCEVTAILVLYGLPRLLTGAILAHELMHAWLRLKGFRNLSLEVEEGICQVLSYMWLESEVIPGTSMPSTSSGGGATASSSAVPQKKAGKSETEKKLGEFFMHQIMHDTSPAYGGGFRAANAAVAKYGLRCTLQHIRHTGSFPP